MKVLGWRRIDLENKESSIHGIQDFCTEQGDDHCVGDTCDSFFASDRVLNSVGKDIDLGDDVIPVYKINSKVLRTIVIL